MDFQCCSSDGSLELTGTGTSGTFIRKNEFFLRTRSGPLLLVSFNLDLLCVRALKLIWDLVVSLGTLKANQRIADTHKFLYVHTIELSVSLLGIQRSSLNCVVPIISMHEV